MNKSQDGLIINLGDMNPIDHGGCFVFRTETKELMVEVYDPEGLVSYSFPINRLKVVSVGDDLSFLSEAVNSVTAGQVSYDDMIEKVTSVEVAQKKVLVPRGLPADANVKDHVVWFSDDIDGIATHGGLSADDLLNKLSSYEARELALGYRCVGEYYGYGVAFNCDGLFMDEIDDDEFRDPSEVAFERYFGFGWIDKDGVSLA